VTYKLIGLNRDTLITFSIFVMNKINIPSLGVLVALLISTYSVSALEYEMGGGRLTIHGYVDFEYTYMDSMIMNMGTQVMPMRNTSFIDQNRLNIITDYGSGSFRVHLGLQARHLFTYDFYDSQVMRGTDTKIQYMAGRDRFFHIQQGFAEYIISEAIVLRGGTFIPPFGIYNDIRYITPLYATVVLPMIYENMPIYATPDGRHQETLPQQSNLMINGVKDMDIGEDSGEWRYFIYGGYGKGPNILYDANDEWDDLKPERGFGVGAKTDFNYDDVIYLGFSSYYYNHPGPNNTLMDPTGDAETIRRLNRAKQESLIPNPFDDSETILGISLEYKTWNERLIFQGEWMNSYFKERGGRGGWYLRTLLSLDKFTPFIMYDQFSDKENTLFKGGMNRIGSGIGFRITDNAYIKGEYHYHWNGDVERLSNIGMTTGSLNQEMITSISEQNMFRTDFILVF